MKLVKGTPLDTPYQNTLPCANLKQATRVSAAPSLQAALFQADNPVYTCKHHKEG
jgi:hypothetical protein